MKHFARLTRSFTLMAGFAAPIVLVAAAGLSRVAAQPPSQPSGEMAGQSKQFKNIKVLKNLPAEKLIPTMREWNASLGVKCDFCHVPGPNHTGFERDDKPTKRVARTMVTMMADLNRHQKPLNNRATCYLCHHGRPEPEFRPGTEQPDRR